MYNQILVQGNGGEFYSGFIIKPIIILSSTFFYSISCFICSLLNLTSFLCEDKHWYGFGIIIVYLSSFLFQFQGLLQSWFAAVGGIARTAGPAFVTYMYISSGPRWTFISADGLLILAILVAVIGYKRLIPYHVFVLKKSKNIITADCDTLFIGSRLQSSSSADTYVDEKRELLAVV